jgi:nucleoside phosphorylase
MPRAQASTAPFPPQVDVAIVTILPEEYEAVKRRLKNVRRDPGTKDQPNQYAWVVGEIEAAHEGTYQVVLAMTVNAGSTTASLGTGKTIARWCPRYVLLVGIAGGLPRDQLGLGDVVVSKQIVSYEYGKVHDGAFNPRPDFVYQVDGPLLRSALSLGETNWRSKLGRRPATEGRKSKVFVGMVGSGEKVIDDRSAEFFASVERLFSKLMAVEMEGSGAATAIQEARDEGRAVGFLMIRGISDMPPDRKPAQRKKDGPPASDRDLWKSYAANAAASFAVTFISQAWPLPPVGPDAGRLDEPRKPAGGADTPQSVGRQMPTEKKEFVKTAELVEVISRLTHDEKLVFRAILKSSTQVDKNVFREFFRASNRIGGNERDGYRFRIVENTLLRSSEVREAVHRLEAEGLIKHENFTDTLYRPASSVLVITNRSPKLILGLLYSQSEIDRPPIEVFYGSTRYKDGEPYLYEDTDEVPLEGPFRLDESSDTITYFREGRVVEPPFATAKTTR